MLYQTVSSETRSTNEAAAMLGVSPNTVRRRIASGELEAVNDNGNHRILLAAIEAAINTPKHADDLTGDLSHLPGLVDARTAAPILGMSVHSVWYHLRQGHLPSRKLGRRVLIPTSAIAAMLSNHDQ